MQNFKKDLKFGQSAEAWLCKKYPKLTQLDGRKCDLQLSVSKRGVELKADRRHNTGNIFLEKYSHKTKKTEGGPFKALTNGSFFFAYMFVPTKDIYVYEVEPLVQFLLANESQLRYHEVDGSNATGFIVPIFRLKHLALNIEDLE